MAERWPTWATEQVRATLPENVLTPADSVLYASHSLARVSNWANRVAVTALTSQMVWMSRRASEPGGYYAVMLKYHVVCLVGWAGDGHCWIQRLAAVLNTRVTHTLNHLPTHNCRPMLLHVRAPNKVQSIFSTVMRNYFHQIGCFVRVLFTKQ